MPCLQMYEMKQAIQFLIIRYLCSTTFSVPNRHLQQVVGGGVRVVPGRLGAGGNSKIG